MRSEIRLAGASDCLGCGACFAACKLEALALAPDERGFLRPEISKESCVSCGACARACPVVGEEGFRQMPISVLACWDKCGTSRRLATSGGAFARLAKHVLGEGGYVCGAVFDSDFSVRHIVANEWNDVACMRGSKYVQSNASGAIKECVEKLNGGSTVLFTGTPCQIDAMRRSAPVDSFERLFLVDVVCHGAPSPQFWQAYLSHREAEEGEAPVQIRFRDKRPSWTYFSLEMQFADGMVKRWPTWSDYYLRAFLGDYITQEGCSRCSYVGVGRVSDITLGDFWGYVSETYRARNTEQGISLVLINSLKGKRLFDSIEASMVRVEKTLEEAVSGNVPLRSNIPPNARCEEFWKDFERGGIAGVAEKYLGSRKDGFKHKLSLLFNDFAYLLPAGARSFLVRLRSGRKGA